jgi:aromatic ring-cleaving dioxygenase
LRNAAENPRDGDAKPGIGWRLQQWEEEQVSGPGLSPVAISDWHAHVYYDAATRPAAEAVRAGLAAVFPAAVLGRWHDQPIGPHPQGSFQVAFAPDLLAVVLPWLMLNRHGLVVLVHPETGDDMADHTDHAGWLGEVLPLRLEALRG